MIIKSCTKGCDPEDRLDIYNFHDEWFKFCPMCGAVLAVEVGPDPEVKPGKPISLSEVKEALGAWRTAFREQLNSAPSPFENLLKR